MYSVPKDYCNKAHDYSFFQNKTAVKGLSVRGNEVFISFLDWSNHYKTLKERCTSCSEYFNFMDSCYLVKYTWGLLLFTEIQADWEK